MRISALFLICGSLALSNAVLAQGANDGGVPTDVTLSDLTPEASTFEQLSTGNQKIAETLFEGQNIPANGNGGTEAWSLNQIAAAKQDGQGWGEVFKQMKADGLVDAKNLGQLVSGHHKASSLNTSTRSEIVVTTGNGRTMSFGRSRHSNRGKGSLNSGKGSLNSGSSRSGHGGGSKFSGFNSGRGSGQTFSNSGHGSRGSISHSGSSSGNSGSGHGKK